MSVQHHDTETIRNHAAFIWSVADLLRGDYKQSEYGYLGWRATAISASIAAFVGLFVGGVTKHGRCIQAVAVESHYRLWYQEKLPANAAVDNRFAARLSSC